MTLFVGQALPADFWPANAGGQTEPASELRSEARPESSPATPPSVRLAPDGLLGLRTEIPLEDVFLVPGNHDVHRGWAMPEHTARIDGQEAIEPVRTLIRLQLGLVVLP